MVKFLKARHLHLSCLLQERHLSQSKCLKVRFYKNVAFIIGLVFIRGNMVTLKNVIMFDTIFNFCNVK